MAMISAKMTQQPYSFCNPTLISSHRINNFAVPISLFPQSRPGLIRHSQATRLLPINKQNSTCGYTKQDNPGRSDDDSRLWIQSIKNVLFYIFKHSVIFLSDLRQLVFMEIISSFTYFLRSKKRTPINISLDKLPGVDAPLAQFQMIIDFLQGNGKRDHASFGILIPYEGVMVYGPRGAGKTTLVHLVARKAGVSFFPVSAMDIANMTDKWFIISLFGEARRCSPSIIFIDDLEFIGSSVYDRNLNQIYLEMEMCEHDGSVVLVIVATDKLEQLDSTLLERWFYKKVYVGNPDEDSRRKFVALILKGALREEDKEAICNLIASQTSGLAWAFLRNIARESRTKAKLTRGDDYVTMDDVVKALEEIKKIKLNIDVDKDEQEDTQFKTESMSNGSQN